jgi:hypothetical protein
MGTAFNVYLTDRYNVEVAWDAEVDSWGATFNAWESSDGTSWSSGNPNVGQEGPYYLRWILPTLAPQSSACITYTLRVQ